mgnify:CR=1 FL=1
MKQVFSADAQRRSGLTGADTHDGRFISNGAHYLVGEPGVATSEM